MRDVWLILCAAAAMLTAWPALKRLDACINARMERGMAEDEEPESAHRQENGEEPEE